MIALLYLLNRIQLNRLLIGFLIAVIVSVMIGIIGYIFYLFLIFSIELHFSLPFLIWLIPLVGLFTVFIYNTIGKEVAAGNKLLFKTYTKVRYQLPFLISPLIFLTTCLSHLVGISIGREGTALQIGAGVAMLPTYVFKLTKFEKRLLLIVGLATGFSAVFGTPMAATFFSIEFFRVKSRLKYWLWIPVLLFAELANAVSLYLGVRHLETPMLIIDWSKEIVHWPYYLLIMVMFLFAALFIIQIFKKNNCIFKKINNEYYRILIGAVIILILYLIWGFENYRCLGVSTIIDSFYNIQPVYASVLKLGLTALAIGVGFRGGEVTPLFFIGAMLGNLFSCFVPVELSLSVALGLLFIFGRCTQTPIATTFLALELFGIHTMFLIFPFIFISNHIYKSKSIYK